MRRNLWALGLVVSLLLLPAAASTFVLSPAVVPSNALFHSGPRGATVSSTNWAGYAVTGPTNSVSFVSGSWVQPAVTCTGASRYAAFWVGIDGYNSRTVEQTGTESDCIGGVAYYSAWYEFFPAYPVTVSTVVHPGDTFKASVTYVSATIGFRISITDVTTGKTVTHAKTVPTAARSSAEWIAEAPYSSGVLPLTHFGTVHFGTDATGVVHTNEATISGTTAVIGAFPAANVHRINMATSVHTKAATSVLTPDGTSFNVTWKHAS
jgi:hypothetical protein